jgi:NAD(P)-dependent dehydrogenase (short-subunit alcohol dehydrogenase family)
MSLVDLSGKRLLITGASSGIGRAISVLCASLGARLIISGRNQQRLNDTFCSLSGQEHIIMCCDLNNHESVIDMVNQFPKLDGIVCCAGIQETCLTKNIDIRVLEKLFNTNYVSTILLITQLLNQKKINKGASIVFISSVAAFRYAEIGNAVYSSTKAALASYARVLALELSSRCIRVNTVSPGMVRTRLLEQFDVTPEQFQEDEKKYPLGYGEPEYVANSVAFLLSDAAKWITGSDLLIDGGLSLK